MRAHLREKETHATERDSRVRTFERTRPMTRRAREKEMHDTYDFLVLNMSIAHFKCLEVCRTVVRCSCRLPCEYLPVKTWRSFHYHCMSPTQSGVKKPVFLRHLGILNSPKFAPKLSTKMNHFVDPRKKHEFNQKGGFGRTLKVHEDCQLLKVYEKGFSQRQMLLIFEIQNLIWWHVWPPAQVCCKKSPTPPIFMYILIYTRYIYIYIYIYIYVYIYIQSWKNIKKRQH